MNFNITNNQANQNKEIQNDNIINAFGHKNVAETAKVTKEYSLNLSNGKDAKAFGMEELKSFDDVRQKASVKNVALENNALAVMSNTMSGADFEKAVKDGFSPEDMSAEDTVTNLDKIKATMAASGAYIPGYTDDLTTEEIAGITGSIGYAMSIENSLKENQVQITKENVESITEVVKLSESTLEPTDDAKKYMLTNDLEPTVNNFYMANHSSSDANAGNRAGYYRDETGYVGKNPTKLDVEELKPQIEKVIELSGLEVNKETLSEAEWLLDKNIPLTEENLKKLEDINSVKFPLTVDNVSKASAAAIADGINVKNAKLTNTESIVTKTANFIKDMRMLEETRLAMTEEASISLLKKGIEVDTKDLQKLVEELKQAEKEYFEPFLMDEKRDDVATENIKAYDDELSIKIDLFKQTTKAVEDIKAAPVDFIGNIINENQAQAISGTEAADNRLSEIAKSAKSLKAEYDKAGKSYETMMTAPRSDMGDSIKKAFRNVDDILESLDLEVTRLNEKAVRTLGYAGIEINEENVDMASRATIAVENVITHMTPARTLKMIRDGENPLDTDIFELSEKLLMEDENTEVMKYSEFLYKLEKSHDITDAEKKAFIGIYRLFKKIEKSDGKLVGDVLKADESMTLSNILSASRSDRQIGNDYKIDDSFGALEKLITSGESITDQILAGFRDKEKDSEFYKAEADSVKEMITKEEAVLKVLENVSEPESPVNMAAVNALINYRGSLFKGLNEKFDSEEKDELKEDMAELQDSFDDEESVKKAYKNFSEKTEEVLKKKIENADTYIDVKSIKLLNKQLSIVSKMADSRTYEVPVEINGEITSINLKLVNDSENAGKVNVTFETESTGNVSAEFTLKNGDVSGFIVSENSYFEGVMRESETAFRQEFESTGVNVSSMYFTSSRGVNIKGNYIESSESDTPATKQLYNVAKAIIKSIQK